MSHSTVFVVWAASALALAASCKNSGGKADGAQDEWRDSFDVDRSRLGTIGANPYFGLEPGMTWTYKGGETVLTITILAQPREVDGVTTRVLEEREVEDGALKEVSRNFFALDRASGDVYYFGEDVDNYKNGRIVNHDSAWRAGDHGARFGKFIAASPRPGKRYFQEIAPGVAMDRVEVVSIDERVETPAGVFDHCVHLKETTPLEKGESHKWYAPGVGMVRDDDLLLVSRGRP